MLTAALCEQQCFDCLKDVEANLDLVENDPISAQVIGKLALVVDLETRRVDSTRRMVDAFRSGPQPREEVTLTCVGAPRC